MYLDFSDEAKKQLKKLPPLLRKKAQKSFLLLLSDYRHPSLRSKKMSGSSCFEARIDYHYRFTFSVENGAIKVITVGSHDRGLGKK